MGGNVYLPVGTKTYDNINDGARLVPTDFRDRYNIAYQSLNNERALPGGDAELGVDINRNLTIYGGGYYFHHSGYNTIAGPKLRATYTFYRSSKARWFEFLNRIRLEGLVSYDHIRGTTWLAGIRFTIGFPHGANPTSGLLRHMADPIRRDINVICETDEATKLYHKDGQLVNVDVVSNTSDISLTDAIDDSDSQVVGIHSTQTVSSALSLGDYDLTISGDAFEFTPENDHTYSVQVGQNGGITQDSAAEIISIDGNSDVEIEHLSLTMLDDTDSVAAITTTGDDMSIRLNDVISDGAFVVNLASDEEATIAFNYNTFSTDADDNNLPPVDFESNGANALLTITSFTHNRIYTQGEETTAITNQASNSGEIIYQGNFSYNVINTYGIGSSEEQEVNSTAVNNYAETGGEITFAGDFSHNDICTIGEYSFDILNRSDSSGGSSLITYASGTQFSDNTLATMGPDSTAFFVVDALSAGSIDFNSNIVGNKISTDGANSFGMDFYLAGSATINVTSLIQDNTFSILDIDSPGMGFRGANPANSLHFSNITGTNQLESENTGLTQFLDESGVTVTWKTT